MYPELTVIFAWLLRKQSQPGRDDSVEKKKIYPQNFEAHVEAPREHDLKYFNAKVSTKWIDMVRNSNQIYC